MRFATLSRPRKPAYLVRITDGIATPIGRAYERPGVDPLRVILESGRNPARVKPIARPFPVKGARYLPPVTAPSKIIAVMANYAAHAKEAGVATPKEPLTAAKYPSSLIGHGATIRYRRRDAKGVDYEGELAFVMGRRARDVKLANALDYVFAYTVCNDITAREVYMKEGQITRSKSFDTFTPVGPTLVPANEVADPQALLVRTRINGQVVQDDTTASMIFSCAEAIAYLSRFMTLEPGDLITSGTPDGAGYFRKPRVLLVDGVRAEVEVEGIGTLRNQVKVAP